MFYRGERREKPAVDAQKDTLEAMGAKVLRCSAVPEGKIIGLDKNYALEMVKAGDVMVEYDKIIDRQL